MNRPVTLSDQIDPARMSALATTLGLRWTADSPLPPFAHQIYFWDARPADQLGRDGHPAVGQGGLIPDMGLPRRMWAGGRLHFAAPLFAGQPAQKTSTVESTARKEGRSGPLAFVTLRHDISQNGRLCVTEWQDLVYRPEARASAATRYPDAPTDADEQQDRSFTSTDLFRYSALTMNGHRIHYDADYTRDTEGYAGLVVHGPLLAQHLMLMAGPGLERFSFRGVSPLTAGEAARLCRRGDDLWVAGGDGRLCMQATRG
ncbi:MAG: MaoC family dehydratase N-terminal domain-containing protein [Paracoccus sp. (in: a-proteobacteria)]|uniref:FAS1-like dehydratase domain-containing protein n=1 Tax=Paracoccus sp. TaxID=267 RepID=UPI0026E0C076|nr:MaoC family dehydratase N-terminal domain-containing protein [Paracoccus sp. (in: a-proteobacteria)]MDO5611613.1 MaoC family dehydratase N-terminal domain-containing protein [Paracoccus sp. (in: a-proteobacteria)]